MPEPATVRLSPLLAGFENPIGRIWCWPLIVRLVVPDRDRDRERPTRRRFASYSVPAPLSECLERDVGLMNRDIRLRQPVVNLTVDREPV